MVFFTCSYCGESVKKPSVSKHYLTKCRNKDPFLTCVDCLKDFKGTEYEAHTKCMTEDERYSAKGYVPKPSQNKGERKQQAWQECIQSVLKKTTLKQDERDVIKFISKYENVPRKKSKFVNFLTNASKQYSNKNDLIDRVWLEIESALKESVENSKEQEKKEEKKLNEIENCEKVVSQTEENVGKKEKKRKRKAEENNVAETSECEKTDENQKKKKVKQNEENAAVAVADVVGNTEILPTEEQQEKKSRKRKACKSGDIEQNSSISDEVESEKKKKKKKNEKQEELTVDQISCQKEEKNDNVLAEKSKKKKKSKSKIENSNSNVSEAMTIEESHTESMKTVRKSEDKENCAGQVEKKMKTKGKVENSSEKKKENEGEEKQEGFNWKDTILQVLNKESKNKKIPLQKLQKKVLKIHCKILNCESSGKKEKKFLKKLKEIPQIEIDEDFVMLKS